MMHEIITMLAKSLTSDPPQTDSWLYYYVKKNTSSYIT